MIFFKGQVLEVKKGGFIGFRARYAGLVATWQQAGRG
jgi:hypothetical protein